MIYSQNPTLLQGILGVEFVPDSSGANILPRLNSLIDKSSSIRIAVAYWTISSGPLHPSFVKKVGKPNGFMCVDFHLPTDIGELCALKNSGADVNLHLMRLAPYSAFSSANVPPHLMHTKLVVFDFSDNTSEIWVGSHNWTPRALQGINVEASISLHVDRSSRLYTDVENYLGFIKNSLCVPIDPGQEAYYKKIQGSRDEIVATVEIEGLNVSNLSGLTIDIFGTDEEELTQVNRVRRTIYVSATESSDSSEHVYEGEILHSGLLTASNPSAGGISFSARRYAFRMGRSFPRLEAIGIPPSAVMNNAAYFVTIELRSKVKVDLYEPQDTNLWEDSWQNAMTERLNKNEISYFLQEKPLFQVPSNPEYIKPKRLLLEEKRAATDFTLVRKKVIQWL